MVAKLKQHQKMKDQIAGRSELIVLSPVVVGLLIPRALKTQLRTYLNRGADPVTPHDRVLRVFGRISRALPFFVVEKIAAE